MRSLSTAAIGRAGELLTQFQFLREGIESAPMTTDTGVDLVAYWNGRAVTIQVKTVLDWKPAGGKGKHTATWWVNDSKRVDYAAFAHLTEGRVWFLSWKEVLRMAFQHNAKGNMHIGFYRDPMARTDSKRLPTRWSPFEGANGIARMKRRLGGASRASPSL